MKKKLNIEELNANNIKDIYSFLNNANPTNNETNPEIAFNN